ncbi:MAG: PilZ domain-containing protein [Candidatus Omnitrophica bacterium]|nr:PilZ domain-containing protein [Candidatus Omnitrophota bacterium]
MDADSADLIETTAQCLHQGCLDILLNLETVDFIDYLGISAIVLAYKEVVNHKGRMKLTNLPAHLKNLFSVSGLDKVIDIYPTEEHALRSFKEDLILEKIKKLPLRRRFKRLPIEIKIKIMPKYTRDQSYLDAEILNLSGVGAYIYGCDKFRIGDEMILKLKLSAQSEEIEVQARVVWLPDKQIQNQLYPGMGIEFYNISPEIQHKIVEFVEKNISLMPTE